jgi:phosphoglycolate phosphatase-like HAD superfamily hydrolase
MSYERVVWDFDGVLVDSRLESWRSASEILALLGIDVSIRSQNTFRKYFTQEGVFSDADRSVLKEMHRLIMKSRAGSLELHPCMNLVAQLTVPSEVITSSFRTVAEKVLGEHAACFVNIRGHESDSKEALLRAASRNAIFITDTVVDVERCRKYSIPVIAVAWGFDPLGELEKARPDFIVESSEQLAAVFRKLRLLDGAAPSEYA